MAKIKYSALVSDIRGKLNGSVASRNRSGSYLRNKVTPLNPNTSAQANARSLLTNLSQGWRALTEAQRAAWNAAVSQFAKTNIFGDLVNPTGKNLYTRLGINLTNIGESILSDPPIPADVVGLSVTGLTIDIGTGDEMTIDTADSDANMSYLVEATPPVSPGKNFVKSEYRLIQTESGSLGGTIDIKSAYVAKFGTPAEGQKVFARVTPVVTATGQKGIAQSASTLVVST